MQSRTFNIMLIISCLVLGFSLHRARQSQISFPLSSLAEVASPPFSLTDDDRLLERHVSDIRFDDVPLDEALSTLCETCKVDILAHWSALEETRLFRTSKVS